MCYWSLKSNSSSASCLLIKWNIINFMFWKNLLCQSASGEKKNKWIKLPAICLCISALRRMNKRCKRSCRTEWKKRLHRPRPLASMHLCNNPPCFPPGQEVVVKGYETPLVLTFPRRIIVTLWCLHLFNASLITRTLAHPGRMLGSLA